MKVNFMNGTRLRSAMNKMTQFHLFWLASESKFYEMKRKRN